MTQKDYEPLCIYCRLFLTPQCTQKVTEKGECTDYTRTTLPND